MILNRADLTNIKVRNYVLNLNELLTRKTILDSKPLSLQILPTNKCNLKCIACTFQKSHDDSLIDKKVIMDILYGNPQLLCVEWSGGGEPLLHPDFESFIDTAYSLYIHQILFTNGLLLTDGLIQKIAKYNVNLILSVDGHTKEIYERHRVNADFDKLIKNIGLIKKYREKYKSKGSLKIYYIVTKYNYKYLADMLKFIEKFGINEIFFSSDAAESSIDVVSHGTEDERKELKNILKRLMVYAEKKSIFCTLNDGLRQFLHDRENNEPEIDDYCCLVPWQQMRILPKGEVVPTYFCYKTVGNINNDSINDIWNSAQMAQYRTKILNHDNAMCSRSCCNKESVAKTHSGLDRYLHILLMRK